MKVEWMRSIDRYVGRPIAYLLSLFIRSLDMLPGKNARDIVVSKYFGLGSIILSTPLLQSLRDRFPNSKILFITFQQNAEVLTLFPFINEVIIIRNDRMFNFIVDTVKTILRFRFDFKIDLFIDMEFFSHYSALMAYLSGSKFKVGYHSSLLPRGRLLTHRVTFNPHRHVTEAFHALGQKIGTQKKYALYNIKSACVPYVLEWSENRGLKEQAYVVINTQGSDYLGKLKQWPIDKWANLITKIAQALKLSVVLTGVKENRADIEKIVTPLLPNHISKFVYNTAGQFTLKQFIALLEKAKFVVTIDSGPLHIAQSLGLPCVALFGPETPILYGPRGKYCRTVYTGIYCSPCYNVLEGKKAECTNPIYNECMTGIEVERVWHEIVDLNNALEANRNVPKFLSNLR